MEEVLRKLSNPKRLLSGSTLGAGRWPEVHQVIVRRLDGSVTTEVLEAYFRNEEKSGCSTLKNVTMKGKRIAIVTLQESQGKVAITIVHHFDMLTV